MHRQRGCEHFERMTLSTKFILFANQIKIPVATLTDTHPSERRKMIKNDDRHNPNKFNVMTEHPVANSFISFQI